MQLTIIINNVDTSDVSSKDYARIFWSNMSDVDIKAFICLQANGIIDYLTSEATTHIKC